jgi:hypothetical protein
LGALLFLRALKAALWSLWRLFGLAEGSGGLHGSSAAVLAMAGKGALRSLWAPEGGARIDGESRCEVERQFIRRVLGGFVPANPSLDH